ncbi:prolyl endopeptidase [Phakopsora pachyrhizi]|uniref:Prolyl endopeptidase n=1 Tax=Phakopsora pachyrhizi TaxID=170000 RepID=A0AAV0BEX1_PHAPC|nr:prolyl endopeptidase [Phakopsora pachyrhizi]CAH7685060.1 prolyl endopeptidase [Phakopsora pachyrhizi]
MAPAPVRPVSEALKPLEWAPHLNPYPSARRDEDFKEVFLSKSAGEVTVPDPYHWLHEPPSTSDETQRFVADQASFTKNYLSKYSHRDDLHSSIQKNWDYARFSCLSFKADGYYYFNFNSGLQAQSAIYRIKKGEEVKAMEGCDGKNPGGELFLDPNLFSLDGTASLSSIAFSDSCKYVAYGVSRSGSDWSTIYVRRTNSPHTRSAEDGGKRGEDPGRMDDVVRFIKFGFPTWLKDESGFFYQRYPEKIDHGDEKDDKAGTETQADLNAMLYFHKLGTPQEEDILIMKDTQNPEYMWGASVTDDGKYLALTTSKDTGRSNRLWIADLESQPLGCDMHWHKIVNEFGSEYMLETNDDSLLYILTNKDAPKRKIVTFDLEAQDEGFKDLITEDQEAILDSFLPINNDQVVVGYARHAKDELYLYDLSTGKRVKRIGENLIGSCSQKTGRRHHTEFFFSFGSFVSPGTVYRYRFDQPSGQELSVFREIQLDGLRAQDFVSEQVFYKSKDGTQVPMFLTYLKNFKKDGTAPALQYGYGGFSISIGPFFSPSLMTFVRHYGAVLAVPNIRGGGEYGEDWHLAGCFDRKQNVFDDFQCATKYLIENKYAAPKKVSIMGGSNGGLLVAACVNQAPELFGAGVAEVGVLDMLRFHKFTIGRAWTADYGNPDDPEAFDYLYKYSPLHNINPDVVYPPLMLLTADHDDRVVPLHSFKHAATLQHCLRNNPNPLLLRVDMKAGHGAGKSTEMRIREAVDKLSFIASSLGLKWLD